MKTPILLIIFNRPETTEIVFKKIREMKPEKLFIAGDGPRNLKEKWKVDEARRIVQKIDWPCEVKTFFHDTNLGCGKAPSTAISWFFEHVEEGIILEDDCVPSKEFFLFCEEMLAEYRNHQGIMMITGNNFTLGKRKFRASHYTSIYSLIWGWATWKRAWDKFKFDMPVEASFNFPSFMEIKERTFWVENYYKIRNSRRTDVWDLQWQLAMFNNGGRSIAPAVNLVSNIGFSEDATHTTNRKSRLFNVPTQSLHSRYFEPYETIQKDRKADRITFKHVHLKEFTLWDKIRKIIR